MALPRRRFLIFAAAAAGIPAVYAAWKWHRGNPADVIIAILRRRVGYLSVEQGSFERFAQEYLKFRARYESELVRLSVFSLPLQFFSPYAWLKQGHALRRLEDNVVSLYLLSTDFFRNGADQSRAVRYEGFYDSAIC